MDDGLLEELQAADAEETHGSRTTAIVVIASVAALVVGVWLGRSPRAAAIEESRPDALAQLAAKTRTEGGSKKPQPERTGAVAFPGKLSDAARPTTALAAVQAGQPKAVPVPVDDTTSPPPATDRLTVVPLPARDLLAPSPAVARPSDALERQMGAAARGGASATPGSAEGYQLQVSSFTVADEAHAFAERLRERGHRAFVATFTHAERGTFYRVRVGPFPTAKLAAEYRAKFEAQEHMAPYLVLPEAKPSH
jgi:cell division septation protein DedD